VREARKGRGEVREVESVVVEGVVEVADNRESLESREKAAISKSMWL